MNRRVPDPDPVTSIEGAVSTFPSPAMPSIFDLGNVRSPVLNMGTISPRDLLINDQLISATNSSALTTLTSPSVGVGSPEFSDYLDVSPHFSSGGLEASHGGDAWFSLFPQESAVSGSDLEQSPVHNTDDVTMLDAASTSSGRRRPQGSPPSGRHSSVSGVNSRRRDKPLPPIIVEDPNDVVAMKRARNTLAARKSRERKAQRVDELQEQIARITADRDHWKRIAEEFLKSPKDLNI